MMVLYSGTTCPFSQRCRFVLLEKGMDHEVREVDMFNKPEEIAMMTPYGEVPILVERDLVLYDSNIINEYIDERFPHPQLMPPDPMIRARIRLYQANFERELFSHVRVLEDKMSTEAQRDQARKTLAVQLTGLSSAFIDSKYLMGDEFTMLDITLAPLLWRLNYYGIELPREAAPLMKYAEMIFSRPAFIEALTPSEKVMRK